jgi:hypothetical protein
MLGNGPASGSPSPAAQPAAVPPAPHTPEPPRPPGHPATPAQVEAPLRFERTQIRIDSVPSHAEIKDLASGTVGRTPFSFTVPSSHTARQFRLRHKDYVDAVVELIPDREKIEFTQKLDRGPTDAPAAVHHETEPGPTGKPEPTVRPPVPPTTPSTLPPPAPPTPTSLPAPIKTEAPPAPPKTDTTPPGEAPIPLKPFTNGSGTTP